MSELVLWALIGLISGLTVNVAWTMGVSYGRRHRE